MEGSIAKKGTLFLREGIGTATATDDNGEKYHLELARVLPHGFPCVTCKETEKTFILPWDAILNLAEKAGILQPYGQE